MRRCWAYDASGSSHRKRSSQEVHARNPHKYHDEVVGIGRDAAAGWTRESSIVVSLVQFRRIEGVWVGGHRLDDEPEVDEFGMSRRASAARIQNESSRLTVWLSHPKQTNGISGPTTHFPLLPAFDLCSIRTLSIICSLLNQDYTATESLSS